MSGYGIGMTNLRQMLSTDAPDMPAIRAYLDGLSHPARLAETRSLGRAEQRRLYDAAKGFLPITVDDIVPPSTPTGVEVPHHGKNTLGVFTEFAKVFVRGEGAPKGELWGYNRNSAFIETVVGPGYYVAYDFHVPGEVLVDYTRLPPRHPEGWPPILSNSSRFSFFVYNGTQDILRGVSKHVSIGRATKGGKDLPAWFILCREER